MEKISREEFLRQLHEQDDRTLLVMVYTEVRDIKDGCSDCKNKVRDLDSRLWGSMMLALGAIVTAILSFIFRNH